MLAAWLERALCPPLHVIHSSEWPPLPLEAGSLDLVYAMPVYTHLTDNWSAWMAEHHRLLRPGGLMLVTLGSRRTRLLRAEWWLRRHWGRGFEFLNLVPDGLALHAGAGQGWVLMRRRDVEVTAEELERDAAPPPS